MQNKKLVISSILILVLIFLGLGYFYKNAEVKKEEIQTNNYSSLLIRDHSIKFGDNKKNISVVEFLDPECESCALFNPIMRKLYKEYHQEIQLVIKYIPNHNNSRFAVKILEASRVQNKYEEVLNVIFEKQALWAEHNNEKPELLWELLSSIPDLDLNKLKEDSKNPEIEKIMDIDTQDAKQFNVRGTPTVFVNEKRLIILSQKELFDLVESKIYK
jgi:protein-disulfide isomerase